ncbi:MAG: hypothetical protein LBN02_08730 [Oscillospiraceae bacterium]|jgi:hypothetical protein|nr:hypothetical protein [Oscillospiraceae bacterium]
MKKHRKIIIISIITALTLTMLFSTTAFAVTESDVQAQVNAQGREAVTGNVFIWFLCAIAFLKISQKIDSFMSSLGINVGHTGGSMMAEAVIAARGVTAGKNLFSGGFGGKGSRGSSGSGGASGSSGADGAGFMAGGLAGVVGRKVQSGAVSNATGQSGGGMFAGIGGKVFQSSLNKGGDYANNVIGAVAKGNINQMGTITGDKAASALQSYMNLGGASSDVSEASHIPGGPGSGSAGVDDVILASTAEPSTPEVGGIPMSPVTMGADTPGSADIPMSPGAPDISAAEGGGIPISPVTLSGDTPSVSVPSGIGDTIAYSEASEDDPYIPPVSYRTGSDVADSSPDYTVPPMPVALVQYSEVEIGGGRITGYDSSETGGESRQFAMYSAEQYIKPEGGHDTLTAVDGSKWYRQYARNAVEKTPYKAPDGSVAYNEKIVQKLPAMPRRKDRV